MGIKFFDLVNGYAKQFTAAVVGGGGSANTLVATNGAGVLDVSFLPAGVGADTVTVVASEALAAGAPVNLYTVSTATNARNADATSANAGKLCDGFVLSAVASGAQATVYRNGLNTGVTGLTAGAKYWLGPTGTYVATPPATAGATVQLLGTAISATSIDVQPGPPYVLA